MKEALSHNIQDIERECKTIKETLINTTTPKELQLFKEWVILWVNSIVEDNNKNKYYLNLNRERLIPSIYSGTQQNVNRLRGLAATYIPILHRHHLDDVFCLKILDWLHQQHNASKNNPFGLSSGGFSILPNVGYPMIYYLPASSQLNLLHFPLFFHEFGHFIYAAHRPEMEDLVKELQNKISEKIAVVNEDNTKKNEKQREKNIDIVETWFSWMQEFFCDTVGLHIGGKSYLHIFSLYLRTLGNSAFYMPEEGLTRSSHPVSWLRIKFLANRAKIYGLEKEANDLEKLWHEMAKLLNIREKYHGYYEESFFEIVNQSLDDMIEEAQPIFFKDYTQNTDKEWQNMNFIELLNYAWDKYLEDFEAYSILEKDMISHYKNTTS
jgi:hypothetical protein